MALAAGHAERHEPLNDYSKGLLLPGDRKSIEPMAAKLNPDRVQAARQRRGAPPRAPHDAATVPIAAWMVDDTGILKKGRRWVGVARESCGPLGKQQNFQVAVSLRVATREASVPLAWRLYLPEEWARDRERRRPPG